MVHSVHTDFIDLDTNCGGDKLVIPIKPLPQVLDQWNGSAPTVWTIASTAILNCLREAGHGAIFRCSILGDIITLVGYWFVDNPTIIQVSPIPATSTEQLIELAHKGIGSFSGTAQARGGQVRKGKTKCYLLEFIWETMGK